MLPKKIPEDFRALITSLNKIDDLKNRVDFCYDTMDGNLETIAEILQDTKMSQKQIKNRIQDYFFTMPQRQNDQRIFNAYS